MSDNKNNNPQNNGKKYIVNPEEIKKFHDDTNLTEIIKAKMKRKSNLQNSSEKEQKIKKRKK